MTDIPASTSTTSSIVLGGTVDGTLEFAGDHDWYRVSLVAGQTYTFYLSGTGTTPVEDTYLKLYNATGTQLLAQNDDSGPGRNSKLVFTATTSGTYYIDAGAWDTTSVPPADVNEYAGTYTLSLQLYTPPPVATYDQIADQLVNGYWEDNGASPHHFNVTQGGTITYNIEGLTAAGQALAIAALGEWSDIIGVTFQRVTTADAQIIFDDSDPERKAYTEDSTGPDGFTASARVQVSTLWLQSYGTSLDSYSFQTYIHEIGHALGLGHAGNYNVTADFRTDALFANDAWSTSIMSYFSQYETSYFSNQGFTYSYAVTPMIADILAMQQMYGLSENTRSGDTVYGSYGSGIYNASSYPDVAVTIYDAGGHDTLDYSTFSSPQRINLNPETFSNVGTGVGNLMIARGVVIEDAFGGSGSDTLIGNAADNRLSGGPGNDSIDGGAGSDTALYLTAGSAVTVDLSITGPQNTLGAGTDTLTSIENIEATPYNDALSGNGADNRISSGVGNDIVHGGGGNDVLLDTAGNALLDGGDGTDTVSYEPLLASITLDLSLGGAQDTKSAGFDTLQSIENVIGTAYNDALRGNAADNILEGRSGADQLNGGDGNDTLLGGAGFDILDGGAGVDILDGGADNDRIIYDPADHAAEVNGGAGNDVLIVNNRAAPTAFDLAAQGFESAQVNLTDMGSNGWSTILQLYNMSWQLTSQDTRYDNGTRTWTAFDPAHAQAWDEVWFNFDSQGREISETYYYDNGNKSWVANDAGDSQPWDQIWFAYDSLGRETSEDFRYDNGSRSWVAFDAAGTQPWTQVWFSYDALGRETSEDHRYDNGTRIWTAFDATGSQTWTRTSFFYDVHGYLTEQLITWDDGHTTDTHF